MVRLSFLLITLLFFCNTLFGQEPFSIRSGPSQLTIPFSVITVDNKLQVQLLPVDSFSESRGKALVNVREIRISDGDLIIDYELTSLVEAFHYTLKMELQYGDSLLEVPSNKRIRGNYGKVSGLGNLHLQTIWTDVTEDLIVLNQSYKLIIIYELFGIGLKCDVKPQFHFKKQLPHYITALNGIGLITLGQVYKGQAKREYKQYQEAYQAGDTETSAQPYLDRAFQKRNTYKVLNLTGAALLAIDGVIVLLQLSNHRKQLRRYKRYCDKPNRFSTKVTFEQNTGINKLQTIGFNISF